MSPVLWALLVLLVGLMLLILEVFIPSAGLLTFLAGTAVVTSIVMVFVYQGIAWGTVYLMCICVMLPVLGTLLIKWWPRSPIGRRVLNLPPAQGRNGAAAHDPAPDRRSQLVGQRGRAKTKMLPSGAIQVAGRTYDAVTEGVPIERGQPVEVIEVRANRIVVRPVSDPSERTGPEERSGTEPLDAVVPDPFDDSLS